MLHSARLTNDQVEIVDQRRNAIGCGGRIVPRKGHLYFVTSAHNEQCGEDPALIDRVFQEVGGAHSVNGWKDSYRTVAELVVTAYVPEIDGFAHAGGAVE